MAAKGHEPGATGLHKSWNGFRSDGYSAGFDTDVAAPPRPAVVWRGHQDAAAAVAGSNRNGLPGAGALRRSRNAARMARLRAGQLAVAARLLGVRAGDDAGF